MVVKGPNRERLSHIITHIDRSEMLCSVCADYWWDKRFDEVGPTLEPLPDMPKVVVHKSKAKKLYVSVTINNNYKEGETNG